MSSASFLTFSQVSVQASLKQEEIIARGKMLVDKLSRLSIVNRSDH